MYENLFKFLSSNCDQFERKKKWHALSDMKNPFQMNRCRFFFHLVWFRFTTYYLKLYRNAFTLPERERTVQSTFKVQQSTCIRT